MKYSSFKYFKRVNLCAEVIDLASKLKIIFLCKILSVHIIKYHNLKSFDHIYFLGHGVFYFYFDGFLDTKISHII